VDQPVGGIGKEDAEVLTDARVRFDSFRQVDRVALPVESAFQPLRPNLSKIDSDRNLINAMKRALL
jgi:hypothetical protein